MQAPSIPSATQTAQAQTASNIDTSTAQQHLNEINQVTPTGSLTYSQSGTNPDGTPITTATSQLNPQTQGLLNSGQQGAQSLLDQINTNPTNVRTLSQQTQDQLDNLASQRLEPQLQRDQASLEQQLANKGIKQGTQAYSTAQTQLAQNQNDARNNLILSGYGTANNEALSEANLPYNQLASLLGSSAGVSQPGSVTTPQAGVAATNVSDLTNQQYQNQLGQYNGQMSALGSIGSTIGGWLFSDERLKEDIHSTGAKTPDGIPIKTFAYKGSPMLNMGVTAQDAEKKRPDAVANVNGRKMVNYDKIGSPMLALGAR